VQSSSLPPEESPDGGGSSLFEEEEETSEISAEMFEIAVGRLLVDLSEVFELCKYEYYIQKQKVIRLVHWFTVEVGTWEEAEELKRIVTERPFYRWRKEYLEWMERL